VKGDAVHEFLMHSADYYENKKARQARVQPLLRTLLGRELLVVGNPDGSCADGTILYSTAQTVIGVPLLLFKLENAIGTGDTDVTLQAGLLYRKFWSHKEVPICSLLQMFVYQLIRTKAAPAVALHSYWLSWDHGCACLAQFSQTNPSSSL
jgi:hypothetical protein